jgi:hypothetical protein
VANGSIENLLAQLEACVPASASELSGQLGPAQRSYARFIALLLAAALKATSRSTPENPQGEILIHPAMKLLTGNSKLSASQAADLIKRLLQIDAEAIEPLMSDPVLKKSLETSLRLRPRATGRKMDS